MYNVGVKNCKFGKSFFLDKTLNFRIHYPFENEKRSKLSREIFRSLDLKNFKNVKEEFIKAKHNCKSYVFDESDKTKIKYFGTRNTSTYLHSGHRDTWFAHSTEGINFWWGITEVNELNGMMLFRKVTNYELEHEKRPAYVKDQYDLGDFEIPRLKRGELLLFDSEILHASRINTSDKTRIVFSGRVNITKPKFYNRAYDIKEPFWIRSEDIKNKDFNKVVVFKREKKNFTSKHLKKYKKNYVKTIQIKANFKNNEEYKIQKVKSKKESIKCLLKFKNLNIGFVKNKKGIYAFNALCPHLKFNLLNSKINGNNVSCQGHGLKFNINTGISSCKKFKIRSYKVVIKNNCYYLKT